jgi:glycosyltransferase involved in cell wall biosynthesis
MRKNACCKLERQSLRGLLRFYRTAQFTLAPNQGMVDVLQASTGRPSFLMPHGVDLTAYSPVPNGKNGHGPFCIGYVGRLTTEKSVQAFVEIERALLAAGERDFQFLIVGEGGQQKWLRTRLRQAEIPGVLRGTELAAAYRRMDAFVFPSETDTFGLVILEAMASGVPVIVRPKTGKMVGVEDGVSGCVSEDFSASLQRLMNDGPLRQSMSSAARRYANTNGWEPIFETLYQTYCDGLAIPDLRRAQKKGRVLS